MSQKQFHAWYSQQAVDAGCGSSYYRSAKSHGNPVEVTCVVEAKDPYVPSKGTGDATYAWPDAQYRGLVTEYVGLGAPAPVLDDLFNLMDFDVDVCPLDEEGD